MLYVINGTDVPDSLPLRRQAREQHLARIRELQDQGRLVLAGPYPAVDSSEPGDDGFTGSLIVAEFDSLEDARSWADADPYVEAGIYAGVSVKPFKQALP